MVFNLHHIQFQEVSEDKNEINSRKADVCKSLDVTKSSEHGFKENNRNCESTGPGEPMSCQPRVINALNAPSNGRHIFPSKNTEIEKVLNLDSNDESDLPNEKSQKKYENSCRNKFFKMQKQKTYIDYELITVANVAKGKFCYKEKCGKMKQQDEKQAKSKDKTVRCTCVEREFRSVQARVESFGYVGECSFRAKKIRDNKVDSKKPNSPSSYRIATCIATLCERKLNIVTFSSAKFKGVYEDLYFALMIKIYI